MSAFYFGPYRQVGHYFWAPGMIKITQPQGCPWTAGQIDGALQPGVSIVRGRRINPQEQPEGKALVYFKQGWGAVSFWDRSVDARYGSNSTFMFESIWGFEPMIEEAKKQFPEVYQRFRFEVVPYSVPE